MKSIVSLSGGMDSATVLAVAVKHSEVIGCVGFNYNSKHNPWELEAGKKVAQHYSIPYSIVDLRNVMFGFKSALLDRNQQIPEGHYEAENMKQTVVPGRNIIFLSILAGEAWSRGAEQIYIGIHGGDHFIYPDCRPAFFEAMSDAISYGTDHQVTLSAPFLYGNKTSIIKQGLELGVPYHLTRTCYTSDEIACGKCGSCNERREAFLANGIEDPIEYQYRGPIPPKPLA